MQDHKKDEYIEQIQKHTGIIYKVIGLYVDDEEDKKDLHQEILLQGWKSFQNFKGKSAFSTWLYKVALNTVLTYQKKHKRKDEFKDQLVNEPATDHKENHEILYQIIKSFNKIDRMLITFHLDGYKNQEIAEITGMTANHINVKIHRLKGRIIEKFKKINHG
jgi:RNA polymerase sigma-70 factor (ECF subfamily)